ncbi:MAG: hypothetical protein WCJ84_05205 [Candidatus Peregrinibacteria bacterium]
MIRFFQKILLSAFLLFCSTLYGSLFVICSDLGTPAPVLSPSPTASPSENILYNAIKERQDAIKNLTGKTEAEKIVDTSNGEVLEVGLQKETIESMKTKVSEDITQLQTTLNQKEEEIKILQGKIKNQTFISDVGEKSLEYQKKELEEEKKTLSDEVQKKESALKSIQAELERLSNIEQIKELALNQAVSLRKELDAKNNAEMDAKLNILYMGIGIFLALYAVKFFLARKYQEQYRHYFTYFDIFSVLGLIFFLIWFFFYIKPEMLVILVFLAGTLVLISQEFIISLLSSFFIVNQYMIGDRIRYRDGEGVIIQLTPFRVVLQVTDEYGTYGNAERRIPNSLFVKQEVMKIKKSPFEKISFPIVFRENISIDLVEAIHTIENNILQKHITQSLYNEISHDDIFYYIQPVYSAEGRQGFTISWQETPQKNEIIKQEIIRYVQKISS